jgi:hypothetical protein
MRLPGPIAAAIASLTLGGTIAFAQAPVYGVDDAASRPIAGWIFTPSIGYAGAWDDNVLIRGAGDNLSGAFTDTISPRALLEFTSRRSEFLTSYEGVFNGYRDLSSLNSFDQRVNASVRRALTRRFAVFVRGSAASTPTTELLELVAVPFVRLGSRLADLHSGVDVAFTKRTSMTATYSLQWVNFDRDPLVGLELLGGHSLGTSASIKHELSQRMALTGSYEMTQATVLGNGHFDIQNGDGGFEYEPSPAVRVFGALGFSRLNVDTFVAPRTGLSWRAGLERRFRLGGAIDAAYSRAFVPSYSFGGTSQNEELRTSLQLPFGRRFYTRSAFAWRRNEPLIVGGLRLKSTWIDGIVGYTVRPWMQIEGFYGGTHQNIDRPGGELNRNRAGFQVITAKPVRIR